MSGKELLEMVSMSPFRQVITVLLGKILLFRSTQPYAIDNRLLLGRRSDIHWQVVVIEHNLGCLRKVTEECIQNVPSPISD